MDIYLIKTFLAFTKRKSLDDARIRLSAHEISCHQYEANLGGNVYKKRIARPGSGKRSSYRVLVASDIKLKCFFMQGYAKNEQQSLPRIELQTLKAKANLLLSYSIFQLYQLVKCNELRRIDHEQDTR